MRKFFLVVIIAVFFLHLSGTNIYANETYVVKSGDSLWKIAQKHGTNVDNLIKLNNLKNDFLDIGQTIIIKTNAPSPASINPATENTSVETPAFSSDEISIYIVKSGDNLWAIANAHNVSVESLLQNNNLTSDDLYIGQELKISFATINEFPDNPSRAGMPISGDRVIQVAAQYLGTPYKYGGSGPGGFDCSGFVKYIYNKFNLNLNRTAASQYSHGVTVTKEELQIGDLVFFAGGRSIDHVGIYSGEGQFIHSSSPRSGGVIYSSLNEGYYARTYVGARRIIN